MKATHDTEVTHATTNGAAHPNAFKGYTNANRETIEKLKLAQAQLEMNDTAFCAGAQVDPTTWSRIKRGAYVTKAGPGRLITAMQRHVKNLFERRDMKTGRAGLNGRDYIVFADYEAIVESINGALVTSDEDGEDKLVTYVAPSGCGKTAAGRQLTTEGFKTCMVTALPSWQTSYFPALLAIARALGLQDEFHTAHRAERCVLEAMKGNGVLIINEFEMLCRQMQDFLRIVLNETGWAILILITPDGYRRLISKGGSGIEQLMRRSEAVIHASSISGGQVQRFLAQHWQITAELKVAAVEVAEEANRFGAFDCIVRIVGRLAEECGEEAPTLEQVRIQIASYRSSVPMTHGAQRRVAK